MTMALSDSSNDASIEDSSVFSFECEETPKALSPPGSESVSPLALSGLQGQPVAAKIDYNCILHPTAPRPKHKA